MWTETEKLIKTLIENNAGVVIDDTPVGHCYLVMMGEEEGPAYFGAGGNLELMAKTMATLVYRNPQLLAPFKWSLEAVQIRLAEEGKLGDW